ncbi:ATP-binding cassette domain-containing protein [Granulicatella sp. zg-ZJ]|uniref:ABC transporter ATP-binding protein n=1 Tax=unclassified Granulicatella TaxID=2630493 RepID=UPI0013C01C1D|nr:MULTISPECIES: dipeptide/oligopeptide/nickel ABC transporter ATP-binding protein [unclassified Granulicatella]NEW62184.1 ATP-binding cassette domain-containing protein [Granulicatella sp. zg-ZJ]NEW66628.1 ATP-binding cassette domain-containing protein [Granulicatella sp. zg-84]QMI85049.1 ABC transporter ATP-binding protein [Carnobacteriaceae bacterium zg-84]
MDKDMILRVENVDKIFKNKQDYTALKQISFSLHQNECLGIVGESGSGKSTLAKVLLGLHSVTKGQIWYKNKDVTTFNAKQMREYRQHIQMVFQNPLAAFSPRMRIGTFLSESLVNYGIQTREEAKQTAKTLLTSVGLDESYLEAFPHELSGGQLQRVVIARAISIHPDIVIYDEATSALDVSVQKNILDLLKQLHQMYQMASIFISHDLAVVKQMTDRILVMYQGEIVEILKSSELHLAQHPYTKTLLDATFSVYQHKSE